MGTYKTYNIGGKKRKVYVPSSKSSKSNLTREKGSTQYTPKSSSGSSSKAEPVITPPKTEVGVSSSEQGLEFFQDAKRRATERFTFPVSGPEAGLTPEQQQSELEAQKKRFGPDYTAGAPGSGNVPKQEAQTAEPQATATYINPETEQTQTIKGSAAEVQAQGANLESQGYQLAESDKTVQAQKTPEEQALEESIIAYQKEVDSMKEQLDASLISDKELRDQRQAITKIWDARIKQVEDINMRNNASLNTQLMRQGSRYVVGTTQGIISEAERQGVVQIGELEAQKQSMILEAEAAARDYNYDVYVKLMDEANAMQDAKITALADLRAAQQAQEQAINAAQRKLTIEDAVTRLVGDGITTDINAVYDLVNRDEAGNLVGNFTLDEIQAAMKVAQPDMSALEGLDQDYRTFAYLQSIGDPAVEGLTYDQYLRMIGNAKRAPTSSGGGTAEERKMSLVSQYAARLVPGQQMPQSMWDDPNKPEYLIGPDGYLAPKAFNWAINSAQQDGMTRGDFFDNFGYMINPQQSANPEWEQYSLSVSEGEDIYTPVVEK